MHLVIFTSKLVLATRFFLSFGFFFPFLVLVGPYLSRPFEWPFFWFLVFYFLFLIIVFTLFKLIIFLCPISSLPLWPSFVTLVSFRMLSVPRLCHFSPSCPFFFLIMICLSPRFWIWCHSADSCVILLKFMFI